MKDFDGWNIQKKKIDEIEKNQWCHERDVWWAKLGVNIGYEQDGKGESHLRPVLIVKKFNMEMCLVVPLTTKQKTGKYYISYINREGVPIIAITSQLRLIDTKRLYKKKERLGTSDFLRIRQAIAEFFCDRFSTFLSHLAVRRSPKAYV